RQLRHGICVAKMLDKTSSIICAFGLASAAPRSPYRHLELCGIALYFFMRKWPVSSLKLSNSQNLIYRACCFP
ncbi:MAG: hypothetical protein PUJ34_05130, partial [Subdoligranulum sp.]|nr:hypothetical protein [Subdoligranulum sp.]